MMTPSVSCITRLIMVISLPNDKYVALTKFTAFIDDKYDVAKIMISVFDMVENIVGKREKCWFTSIFSFFPQCYQKAFFRVVISCNCVVKS